MDDNLSDEFFCKHCNSKFGYLYVLKNISKRINSDFKFSYNLYFNFEKNLKWHMKTHVRGHNQESKISEVNKNNN